MQLALREDLPVPPGVRAWLDDSLRRYFQREGSLDTVLGLTGKGLEHPFAHALKKQDDQAALERMMELQAVGATIDQAATLVRAWTRQQRLRLAHGTLKRLYSEAGLRKVALTLRSHGLPPLDQTLADYERFASDSEIKETLSAIRISYAKRGI